MAPGEEIDMSGTFDFVRLNIKYQKTIRMRTTAIVLVLGEGDERKVVLFRRFLKTMCGETGKPGRTVQSRLDACKLSVHCLYDIALSAASEGKMVLAFTGRADCRLISSDVFSLCRSLPRRCHRSFQLSI